MATGRNIQLTKQIGENLVVAELGRRGYIATTFTGNVPEIDILASSPNANTFGIQVKAIQGTSWQFDVRAFLNVELIADTQIIHGAKSPFSHTLTCVFVKIRDYGSDEFYIFHWGFLQDYFIENYKGGIRPRNPSSFHCAIWLKEVQQFKDNWSILPDFVESPKL